MNLNLNRARAKGVGVGLRKEHYSYVLKEKPAVSWFEAISENYMGPAGLGSGRPLDVLREVRKNFPVVLHGVSLSIGSVDSLNFSYLEKLKRLIEEISPAWVSDHLCWTGVHGKNIHDLMPIPFTKESLDHVVRRVDQVQNFLGRTFVFENVSSYVSFRHSSYTEWDFLREVSLRSGCELLLDVNNVYVSSRNHGFDPLSFLEAIPKEKVRQFHLAGYTDGEILIDTHDHPVSDPVWELFRKAVQRFGKVPTLIEWDDRIPEFSILVDEARKAEKILEGYGT